MSQPEKQGKILGDPLNPQIENSGGTIYRYAGIIPSTYYQNWRSNPEFSK